MVGKTYLENILTQNTHKENRMYNQYDKIAYDSIDFEEMQAETQSIARDILENVSVLNDSMQDWTIIQCRI